MVLVSVSVSERESERVRERERERESWTKTRIEMVLISRTFPVETKNRWKTLFHFLLICSLYSFTGSWKAFRFWINRYSSILVYDYRWLNNTQYTSLTLRRCTFKLFTNKDKSFCVQEHNHSTKARSFYLEAKLFYDYKMARSIIEKRGNIWWLFEHDT